MYCSSLYFQQPTTAPGSSAEFSTVETLTETFSTRYSKAPSAEKMREMKALFQKQGVPSIEEIMQHQTASLYQLQIDKLHRKGWLTETIREYLAKPGWPEN